MNNIKHISQDSLIGPLHVTNETPNQDYANTIVTGDYTILALADGAGSLERSDEGALLAVETFLSTSEGLLQYALESGVNPNLTEVSLQSYKAAKALLELADLAETGGCTLTTAIVTKDDFIVSGIGDSFGVIQTDNEELHLVQPPEAGEYANITKLITSETYDIASISGKSHQLRSIALCSDAFEQATLKDRVPTVGFWNNIFKRSHDGSLNITDLLNFMAKQEKLDDDATLIVTSFNNQTIIDESMLVYMDYDNYDVETM